MKVYISCPYSFKEGVKETVKHLKKLGLTDISNNTRGEDYDASKLQESDFVIFVLEDFKWSQPLNTMSKGILSEFVWCLNHRKPYYICYRSATGLGIYGAQIDETAVFRGGESILLSGVASTKDSLPLVAQTCSNIYYMGGNLYIKSGEDKSSIETESNFY